MARSLSYRNHFITFTIATPNKWSTIKYSQRLKDVYYIFINIDKDITTYYCIPNRWTLVEQVAQVLYTHCWKFMVKSYMKQDLWTLNMVDFDVNCIEKESVFVYLLVLFRNLAFLSFLHVDLLLINCRKRNDAKGRLFGLVPLKLYQIRLPWRLSLLLYIQVYKPFASCNYQTQNFRLIFKHLLFFVMLKSKHLLIFRSKMHNLFSKIIIIIILI